MFLFYKTGAVMNKLIRAYNISELGLMRLEDVLKAFWNSLEGPVCMIDILLVKGATIDIPIKSYAASVVERFAENVKYLTFDRIINACYNPSTKHIILESVGIGQKANQSFTFYCPINPFTGLLNPDGTQRTSATREEIEQWRMEG